MAATFLNNTPAVKLFIEIYSSNLLQQHANGCLIQAIKNGNLTLVKLLVDTAQARPSSLAEYSESSSSVLLFAVRAAPIFSHGNIKIIEYILQSTYTDVYENKGSQKRRELLNTCLQEATENFKLELMKCFIRAGADVNNKRHGNACLHISVGQYGAVDMKIIKFLLQETVANTEIKNRRSNTVLLTALKSKFTTASEKLKITKLLIQHSKVNLNATDKRGDTALHLAIRDTYRSTERLELVQMLVKNGADLELRNQKQHTAWLSLSTVDFYRGYHIVENVIRWFIEESGADINAVDGKNNTILHLALKDEVCQEEGDFDLIKCLMVQNETKDFLDYRNSRGKTAREYAEVVADEWADSKLKRLVNGLHVENMDTSEEEDEEELDGENMEDADVLALDDEDPVWDINEFE